MTRGLLVFLVAFIFIAGARLKSVARDGSGQGACSFVALVFLAAIACTVIAIGLNMKG